MSNPVEDLKNAINAMKQFADETNTIASFKMLTKDGYIVKLVVKKDDGSFDEEKKREWQDCEEDDDEE